MPKRSNPFQRLIHLIESQLAPEGAAVEESDEVVDKATGKTTEVDVTVTYIAARVTKRTLIECRDRARKDDVQWIRELYGKCATLNFDRSVAVSRRGFSEQAVQLAKFFRIETLSLEAAEHTDWAAKLRALRSLVTVEDVFIPESFDLLPVSSPPPSIAAALNVNSQKLRIALPSEPPSGEGPAERVVVLDDLILELLNGSDQRRFVAQRCAESPDGIARVELDLPAGSKAVGKRGRRWPISGLRVKFRCLERSTEVALQHHTYGDLAVAIGAGTAATGPIEVAVTQAPGAPPKGSVRMVSGGRSQIVRVEIGGK